MSRLASLVLLALLLGGWEIACRALQVPAYFLPPPSAVAVALSDNLPVLVAAAWRTLSTALIALVLASLIAQALAIVTALSPLADRAIRPAGLGGPGDAGGRHRAAGADLGRHRPPRARSGRPWRCWWRSSRSSPARWRAFARPT